MGDLFGEGFRLEFRDDLLGPVAGEAVVVDVGVRRARGELGRQRIRFGESFSKGVGASKEGREARNRIGRLGRDAAAVRIGAVGDVEYEFAAVFEEGAFVRVGDGLVAQRDAKFE